MPVANSSTAAIAATTQIVAAPRSASPVSPLALAGMVAGMVAFEIWRYWENSFGHATLALKIGAVFVPALAAGLSYGIIALAFKIPAAKEMSDFALQKFRARPKS